MEDKNVEYQLPITSISKQDAYTLIDLEDLPKLKKYNWYISHSAQTWYAVSNSKGSEKKTILMHRLIMDCPENKVVDHINHNGLDNRKSNLRLATHKENCRNKIKNLNSKSNYKGVTWEKYTNSWATRIDAKTIGRFKNEIHAAMAWDIWARDLQGQYAYLNFPNSLHN